MGRPRQNAPQRPPANQQAPSESGPTEAEVAAAIAAVLGGAVVVASPLAAIAFLLGPVVAPFGLSAPDAERVATDSARLVLDDVPRPPAASTLQDPLGRAHIHNLLRRGQFAIAVAKRVARRVGAGTPVREAFSAEASFLEKHRQAEADRISSAEAARAHLRRYGRQATWTHGDPAEPRPHHLAADGGQFDVLAPPASVGNVLPGVLPGCTCSITAPRPGARRLT
jgi:hypothetical protein